MEGIQNNAVKCRESVDNIGVLFYKIQCVNFTFGFAITNVQLYVKLKHSGKWTKEHYSFASHLYNMVNIFLSPTES